MGVSERTKSHVTGQRIVLVLVSPYSSFQSSLCPNYLLPPLLLPLNLIEPLCGIWLVTQARRAGPWPKLSEGIVYSPPPWNVNL